MHMGGHLCEMKPLQKLARTHGLHLVEDAAQAICGSLGSRRAGSFSTAAAFSMNPMKVLHGYGEAGAVTIGIANNAGSPLLDAAEHPILLETGPEPIGGSTRMTAGTAQKVTLNLFSTLVMIRLGRVYRGMMVDVIASSDKLRDRAARIVMEASGVEENAARQALAASENAVKPAVLIARGLTLTDAQILLDTHGGDLRLALAAIPAADMA